MANVMCGVPKGKKPMTYKALVKKAGALKQTAMAGPLLSSIDPQWAPVVFFKRLQRPVKCLEIHMTFKPKDGAMLESRRIGKVTKKAGRKLTHPYVAMSDINEKFTFQNCSYQHLHQAIADIIETSGLSELKL